MSKQVLLLLYSMLLLGCGMLLDLLAAEFLHIALSFSGLIIFYLALRMKGSEELVIGLAMLCGIFYDNFWGRPGLGFLLYGLLALFTILIVRHRYRLSTLLCMGGVIPIWLLLPYYVFMLSYKMAFLVWREMYPILFIGIVIGIASILPLIAGLDFISQKLRLLSDNE